MDVVDGPRRRVLMTMGWRRGGKDAGREVGLMCRGTGKGRCSYHCTPCEGPCDRAEARGREKGRSGHANAFAYYFSPKDAHLPRLRGHLAGGQRPTVANGRVPVERRPNARRRTRVCKPWLWACALWRSARASVPRELVGHVFHGSFDFDLADELGEAVHRHLLVGDVADGDLALLDALEHRMVETVNVNTDGESRGDMPIGNIRSTEVLREYRERRAYRRRS